MSTNSVRKLKTLETLSSSAHEAQGVDFDEKTPAIPGSPACLSHPIPQLLLRRDRGPAAGRGHTRVVHLRPVGREVEVRVIVRVVAQAARAGGYVDHDLLGRIDRDLAALDRRH